MAAQGLSAGQCAEKKNYVVLRPKFDVWKLCPPPQRSGNLINQGVERLYDPEVEGAFKIKFLSRHNGEVAYINSRQIVVKSDKILALGMEERLATHKKTNY